MHQPLNQVDVMETERIRIRSTLIKNQPCSNKDISTKPVHLIRDSEGQPLKGGG